MLPPGGINWQLICLFYYYKNATFTIMTVYAECRVFNVMKGAIVLNAVIILSVVAPLKTQLDDFNIFRQKLAAILPYSLYF